MAFDDQIFQVQRRGGASRYFARLHEHLRPLPGVEVLPSRLATFNEHAQAAGCALVPPPWLDRPGLLSAVNRVRRPRADIIHHTYYHPAHLRLPPKSDHRVVTLLDMTPELFPELFTHNPHRAKREYVARADLVLAISQSTRVDAEAVLGDLGTLVRVVPLGVDPVFAPSSEPLPGLPPDYLLYVGNRGGYKDFSLLVQALAIGRIDLPLVCVGGGAFTPTEEELLLKNMAHAIQIDVDDRALASAYSYARAFVFPSRYEGFGLPTLEAMACGCPSILAGSSSHPEVGGDVAFYFEPSSAESLAATLWSVLHDAELAAARSRSGILRAGRYTWERTAELTAEAYALLG